MTVIVIPALSIFIIVFLISICIPVLRMERTIADLTDTIETKVHEFFKHPHS